MEEEALEICQPSKKDWDGLSLFDTTILESLSRWTDEIQDGLLTDGDSDVASDSYDSDVYTDDDDDDDDPDSGENKLFNMMDDLVMELQLELNASCDPLPLIEATTENNVVGNTNGVADVNEEVESETMIIEPTPPIHNPSTLITMEDHSSCTEMPPLEFDNTPSMDRTNVQFPIHGRAEKQRRLHTQVKQLLQHVSMMTELNDPEREIAVGFDVGDQRKTGGSSADKLEQCSGALSSCSIPTEAQQPPNDTAVVSPATAMSEGQIKTAIAMSSYTQRKRRQYLLQRKAAATAAAANEEHVSGCGDVPATVTPSPSKRSSGTTSKKKMRRPRTKKHNKGKIKKLSLDTSELRYQQYRQMQLMQRQRQQQSCHVQQPNTIRQESLRELLSQILALEERLSREQMMG
jgi:hypothetical protein